MSAEGPIGAKPLLVGAGAPCGVTTKASEDAPLEPNVNISLPVCAAHLLLLSTVCFCSCHLQLVSLVPASSLVQSFACCCPAVFRLSVTVSCIACCTPVCMPVVLPLALPFVPPAVFKAERDSERFALYAKKAALDERAAELRAQLKVGASRFRGLGFSWTLQHLARLWFLEDSVAWPSRTALKQPQSG